MTVCSGCSRIYPYLDGERCMPCTTAPKSAKLVHEWPTCTDCGSSFEFLASNTCSPCIKRAEASDTTSTQAQAIDPKLAVTTATAPVSNPSTEDIHYAMTHPVNVRKHGTSGGTSTMNPYLAQPLALDLDLLESSQDLRAQKAFRTIHSFKTGYADAMARHNPHILGVKVAKSKLKGESQTMKPMPRLNIAITAVLNRNMPSLKVPFDPFAQAHPEDREFQDVIDSFRLWLDGIYSKEYKYRIQSNDDFSILYSTSTLALVPVAYASGTTLRHLWDKSIEAGIHVKAKDIKSRLLNLTLRVNFPLQSKKKSRHSHPASDNDSDEDLYATSMTTANTMKRKAETYIERDDRSFKRPLKNSYMTKISRIPPSAASDSTNTSADSFIVKKLKFKVNDAGDGFDWTTEADEFKILVEKMEFASGVTKKAYKLSFGSKTFCAKKFYSLGGWAMPSLEENQEHLQEEVLRHHSIRDALNNFLMMAKKKKISVHELRIASSMLLVVSDGPQKGLTWLVDELLDHEKMRKFSGTDTAGAARPGDFVGITCDAFAHFVAADSDLDFVVVDIQGIITPIYQDGVRCADTITLFDLLAHSKCQTMGLGDRGLEGIEEFCQQHQCNGICKQFKLTDLNQLWKGVSNLSDVQSPSSDPHPERRIHPRRDKERNTVDNVDNDDNESLFDDSNMSSQTKKNSTNHSANNRDSANDEEDIYQLEDSDNNFEGQNDKE